MSGTGTCEQAEFYYSCESMLSSDNTRVAKSGFSDVYKPLRFLYKVTVSEFAEDYDPEELKSLYQRQVTCSTYGDMFLRMHFLHLSKKRIVSDHYQWNLVSWLEEKKGSKKDWGKEWWDTIKEDFIAIFKPVCQGLKKMHLMEEYHGNLSMETGIKIQVYDKHVNGVLTNMAMQDAADLSKRNKNLVKDIKSLCTIIWNVMKFPFTKDGVPVPENLTDEPNDPANIHEHFMNKLDVLDPSIKTMNSLVRLDFDNPINRPLVFSEFIVQFVILFFLLILIVVFSGLDSYWNQ
ncbi:hypothetical protein PIB30_091433 [Stylosanthes scabra]|uniref:Uncharacterized protein n=1 Tax=Stylosanthes scabra TaxID=79078 RepID=A0ABU6ZT90_9FABA|nr:hypothetical protein [Stylosanthes scabra]